MEYGEFSLINRYFKRIKNIRKDLVLGVGDDCALLSVNEKMWIAVSTDTLVSGIHFLPNINPSDLSYKSLAANLSDLAAMGADPAWISLALTLPFVNEKWLTSFSETLFQQLDYYHIELIGGDITRGPLSVTLTIHGLIPIGCALTRGGARVGDKIYVTGTLGDSAGGLAILQNRLRVKDNLDKQYLLQRHLRPSPRVFQGKALRKLANSAIDISDGIIKDLSHILTSSHCGAYINLDNIPISPFLLRNTTYNQALSWAISGGEDYELCFTVPEIYCNALNTVIQNTNTLFTCIGEINSSNEKIKFVGQKTFLEHIHDGYEHFKTDYNK